MVSIPLAQKTVSVGKVVSVGANQLVVQGRQWTAGTFRTPSAMQNLTYYAEFGSGALKGVRYRVLDNSEDTLVLDTEGDDLTAHQMGSVTVNDLIRLRPLWTVGLIFGTSDADVVIGQKPNPLIPSDSILMPDNQGVGQNKAPTVEISYTHSVGWRASGNTDTDQVHAPFRAGEPMIIRRIGAAGLTLPVLGHVLPGTQSTYVAGGNGTSGNDVFVSWLSPEPAALDYSGLHDLTNPALSVVGTSVSIFLRGDELLSFGAGSGFNLAPERSFFYLNNTGWQEFGTDSRSVGSQFFLEPGKAYIVRKRASSSGVDWIQNKGN